MAYICVLNDKRITNLVFVLDVFNFSIIIFNKLL